MAINVKPLGEEETAFTPMTEYRLVVGVLGIVFDEYSEAEAKRQFDLLTRTLYPMTPLNALVEKTTCSGQPVRRHRAFDRCRWRPPGPLPALCKSDTGYQFPATTLDFLRIPTQGIALSAC
jgi:hypothetical protein